jgi:hypothetical protein
MMFFPGRSIFGGVMGVFIEPHGVNKSLELNTAAYGTVGKYAILRFICRGVKRAGRRCYRVVFECKHFAKGPSIA